MRMGRFEEARQSLAWALQIDPKDIALPAVAPTVEQTRWTELSNIRAASSPGALTGLSQTGGVALALWQVTLLVIGCEDHRRPRRPKRGSGLPCWRLPVASCAHGSRMHGVGAPRGCSAA